MHLSSLTLKGFKSFASATTLRLEQEVERLRSQRDAAIAHDLLSLADEAEPALA